MNEFYVEGLKVTEQIIYKAHPQLKLWTNLSFVAVLGALGVLIILFIFKEMLKRAKDRKLSTLPEGHYQEYINRLIWKMKKYVIIGVIFLLVGMVAIRNQRDVLSKATQFTEKPKHLFYIEETVYSITDKKTGKVEYIDKGTYLNLKNNQGKERINELLQKHKFEH